MPTLRLNHAALVLLASAALYAPLNSTAQTAAVSPLVGRWQVDLRPTPDAAPYLKSFEVQAVTGRSFKGSFYDAAFAQGLINADWGDLRIAFTTADGNTEYHHSATLRNGRLEGVTHAPGRNFLAVWTATREAAR